MKCFVDFNIEANVIIEISLLRFVHSMSTRGFLKKEKQFHDIFTNTSRRKRKMLFQAQDKCSKLSRTQMLIVQVQISRHVHSCVHAKYTCKLDQCIKAKRLV